MKKLLDYIAIALFPGLLFVGFIAVIVIMVKDIFASSWYIWSFLDSRNCCNVLGNC